MKIMYFLLASLMILLNGCSCTGRIGVDDEDATVIQDATALINGPHGSKWQDPLGYEKAYKEAEQTKKRLKQQESNVSVIRRNLIPMLVMTNGLLERCTDDPDKCSGLEKVQGRLARKYKGAGFLLDPKRYERKGLGEPFCKVMEIKETIVATGSILKVHQKYFFGLCDTDKRNFVEIPLPIGSTPATVVNTRAINLEVKVGQTPHPMTTLPLVNSNPADDTYGDAYLENDFVVIKPVRDEPDGPTDQYVLAVPIERRVYPEVEVSYIIDLEAQILLSDGQLVYTDEDKQGCADSPGECFKARLPYLTWGTTPAFFQRGITRIESTIEFRDAPVTYSGLYCAGLTKGISQTPVPYCDNISSVTVKDAKTETELAVGDKTSKVLIVVEHVTKTAEMAMVSFTP